jgi:nucleoside-diphosphate-sugar epimerase
LERTLKISKAEELLGFSPKWNLSDGLAATLDWYKNYFGHA